MVDVPVVAASHRSTCASRLLTQQHEVALRLRHQLVLHLQAGSLSLLEFLMLQILVADECLLARGRRDFSIYVFLNIDSI